jgi:hypothetical protein
MRTNKTILREYIDRIVLESVASLTEKKHSIDKKFEKKVKKTKNDKSDNKKSKSGNIAKKKAKVLDALDDPMTNDAELMRQLWHPETKDEEDAMRSEFSKKARETTNDNGSTYHFDTDEIVQLYNMLP